LEITQVGPGVVVLPSGANRERWLKVRTTGIGGSDIAAVIEASPWASAFDIWAAKTGRSDGIAVTEAMHWGTVLEEPVANEWARWTESKIVTCGLLKHSQHAIALANVDRLILEGEQPVAVLEVKTGGRNSADQWSAGQWPEEGRLPPQYACQVLWYLGVTGLPAATVACLLGGQELVQVRMNADPELFAAMLEDAERFWHDHVEADVPPSPDRRHIDLLGKIYPDSEEDSIALPDNVVEDLRSLVGLRDAAKQVSGEADDLEARIKETLGRHAVGEILGEKAVTWRTQTRSTLRVADLRKELPDVASKYDKQTQCRVFLVNKRWAQSILGTGDSE
jgi:putative phage-type endonuclease